MGAGHANCHPCTTLTCKPIIPLLVFSLHSYTVVGTPPSPAQIDTKARDTKAKACHAWWMVHESAGRIGRREDVGVRESGTKGYVYCSLLQCMPSCDWSALERRPGTPIACVQSALASANLSLSHPLSGSVMRELHITRAFVTRSFRLLLMHLRTTAEQADLKMHQMPADVPRGKAAYHELSLQVQHAHSSVPAVDAALATGTMTPPPRHTYRHPNRQPGVP
jgi:hypothetical protein